MPSRDFADGRGTRWRVWSTRPVSRSTLSPDYADGWLTFESENDLRRLAPVPAQWEDASDERLDLMCRAAQSMPRHTGPLPPISREDQEEERAGER